MTNLVLITREDTPERYQLAAQAISSILANSKPDQFTLTIVTDGRYINRCDARLQSNISELIVLPATGILGQLRNLGAWWSERKFGRGEYLCFLDNDIAVTDPKWLEKMGALLICAPQLKVIGGCQHPFHVPHYDVSLRTGISFKSVDAVAGYSMFMTWDTWDKFGPFDANAPGTGQSEDWALCRRVSKEGFLVDYIDPPVLSHCGVTNTSGEPAVGAAHFPRIPGLLYL